MKRPTALALLLALFSGTSYGQTQATLDAADKLVAMKRYHEAIEAIRPVIAKLPNDPSVNAILGKAQFHLARFTEAKSTFETARRVDPKRFEQWTAPFLARIEFWYGNDDKAREYLAQVTPADFVFHGLPVLLDPPDMQPTVSKHYIVYVDTALAERQAGRFAATIMDLIYNTYAKVFPFEVEKIYNRVYIFGDSSKYDVFTTRLRGKSLGPSKSFYSENYRALIINGDPQGTPTDSHGLPNHVISRMFNTGFSQFSHLHAPSSPQWFKQGMCAYFEGTEVKGKKVAVGQIIRKDPRGEKYLSRYQIVQRALSEESFLPLSALLTISDEDFNDETNHRSQINAAHSWSFIHFLLHDRSMKGKGRKLLASYFMAMKSGSSREEAFSQSFGQVNLKALQEAWLVYVKNL